MKKQYAAILIMCLGLALWGCGSEEKVQETEETEYTYEENEENDEEITEDNEEEIIEYCEATQEIKDADFEDFKFQVDDVVFKQDYTMTVGEMIEQFSDAYEVKDKEGELISLDRLMPSGEKQWIYLYRNDEWCISFGADNLSEETIELKDCNLRGLGINRFYDGAIYFAKGIPYNDEIISEDERFNYENIDEYLNSLDLEKRDGYGYLGRDVGEGNTILQSDSGLKYSIKSMGENPIWLGSTWGEKKFYEWPDYEIEFTIDPDSRKCVKIDFYFSGVSDWQ